MAAACLVVTPSSGPAALATEERRPLFPAGAAAASRDESTLSQTPTQPNLPSTSKTRREMTPSPSPPPPSSLRWSPLLCALLGATAADADGASDDSTMINNNNINTNPKPSSRSSLLSAFVSSESDAECAGSEWSDALPPLGSCPKDPHCHVTLSRSQLRSRPLPIRRAERFLRDVGVS